jgi:cytochrome c-type biogenesis protein CcmH/NrfG
LTDAEHLLDTGALADACALGERSLREHPGARALQFLGRCYMRLGEPERARRYYREYLRVAPTAPDAAFVRAIVGEAGP